MTTSETSTYQTMAPVRLGLCSWSLEPTSPAELAQLLRTAGVDSVQLGLDPLRNGDWPVAETMELLRDARIRVVSGMLTMAGEDYSSLDAIRDTGGLRPDETWPQNRAAAEATAELAARLQIPLVTFHAGFIPHDRASEEYQRITGRIREITDLFAERGISVALETGQETTQTLLAVLTDLGHPRLGVNYDPANMLLYGMGDPVAALQQLDHHIFQIHIKDAVPSKEPGEWGTETPVGRGAVDWKAFFDTIRTAGPHVNLLVERESGQDRLGDIQTALQLVRSHIPALL